MPNLSLFRYSGNHYRVILAVRINAQCSDYLNVIGDILIHSWSLGDIDVFKKQNLELIIHEKHSSIANIGLYSIYSYYYQIFYSHLKSYDPEEYEVKVINVLYHANNADYFVSDVKTYDGILSEYTSNPKYFTLDQFQKFIVMKNEPGINNATVIIGKWCGYRQVYTNGDWGYYFDTNNVVLLEPQATSMTECQQIDDSDPHYRIISEAFWYYWDNPMLFGKNWETWENYMERVGEQLETDHIWIDTDNVWRSVPNSVYDACKNEDTWFLCQSNQACNYDGLYCRNQNQMPVINGMIFDLHSTIYEYCLPYYYDEVDPCGQAEYDIDNMTSMPKLIDPNYPVTNDLFCRWRFYRSSGLSIEEAEFDLGFNANNSYASVEILTNDFEMRISDPINNLRNLIELNGYTKYR